MNHGDKVKYCEDKKFTNPNKGDVGIVIGESLDGTCLYIRFKTGDIWLSKNSIEVIK